MTTEEGPIPIDHEIAEDLRSETFQKTEEALDRLGRTNTDRRVLAQLQSLRGAVEPSSGPLDLAGLLSLRRAIAEHAEWLRSPDGRTEAAPDAASFYTDLAATLDDLLACYPDTRTVDRAGPAFR